MTTQFKYKLGQEVGYREEAYTIVQKRLIYNRPYYRLSDGSIVYEGSLYA